MKQRTIDEIVADEFIAIGIEVSTAVLERLARCLRELHPVAYRFGLTNYSDIREFTSQLVCPALWVLHPDVQIAPLSPLLDFGAGSGAVGIALGALLPEAHVVLADRRARVVQFLDLAVKRLALANCSALEVDLGHPPADLVGTIGTVLIRAFGPTDRALAHAARLLGPDGAIALWHQPPSPPPPDDLQQLSSLVTSVDSLALTTYYHGP